MIVIDSERILTNPPIYLHNAQLKTDKFENSVVLLIEELIKFLNEKCFFSIFSEINIFK